MATKAQETKKEMTKEDQELMDFIKLSYDTINKLYNENLINSHPADRVYWIARAIGRALPNEVMLMYSMESIIDAFDAEMEDWSKSKIEAKSRVSEKLNLFNKQFDNPITISTMATPGTLRRFNSKTITMIKIPTFIKNIIGRQ